MARERGRQSAGGIAEMPRVIDVHAHVVPADFPAAPAACDCAAWPGMVHHADGKASVMLGTREFRKLDNRSWDVPRRLSDMDAEDVAIQALSPMPDLLSYWIDAASALELARHINGAIATMIAAAPDRFTGLGMVPLQNPDLAAAELTRLKNEGLVGIEIGSNIDGVSPGDARFDPVYAECERLGLAVFVHALRPTTTDRLVGPKPPLAAFIGFPSDVGFAAASFVSGRTLEKFPALRIGFSHGGGTFAAILPRLQNGWKIAPELKDMAVAPVDAARRMFYDNIVMHRPTLEYLLASFGDTQIFAGSDYPYLAGQSHPGRPFEELGLADTVTERLLAGNARTFLGLGAR